jgi:predicted nucleic acid-binding protein
VREMVFVDTSVWVAYFRGKSTPVRNEMDRLLDLDEAVLAVPVRIELVAGVKVSQHAQLQRVLGGLRTFYPSDGTWNLMERWAGIAGRAGDHFGVADLLVAAVAAENHGSLWSVDGDFARLHRLGFIRLHAFGKHS